MNNLIGDILNMPNAPESAFHDCFESIDDETLYVEKIRG
jgi:hypothetical protein